MLSESEMFNILRNLFKVEGFARHQIDTFNSFINFGISKILTEESNIVIANKNQKYTISFSDVYIPKPNVIEENRELKKLYPNDARIRDLSYCSPIYVSVVEKIEIEGKETVVTKHPNIIIGKIPIMLRSSKCYLSSMNKEERIKAGECPFDQGGYFVVKGKERVIVAQIRGVYNVPIVMEQKQKQGEKYSHICEIRSMSEETGHSVLVQALIFSKNKSIVFSLPHIKELIPSGIVFKALGFVSDLEIENLIGMDGEIVEKYIKYIIRDSYMCEPENSDKEEDAINIFIKEKISIEKELLNKDFLVNGVFSATMCEKSARLEWKKMNLEQKTEWFKKVSIENALYYIGNLAIHDLKEKNEKIDYARQVVEGELFPHMGILCSNKEKAYFLGHMINKLLATKLKMRNQDDRDDYINKRVQSSGVLCYELFRQLFKKFIDAISSSLEKKSQPSDIISIISKLTTITNGFNHCFGTGNWGVPKNSYVIPGVVQLFPRLSYGAALSNLRRVAIPAGKEGKNTKIRQINGSQIMFICPCETPEGVSVGIVLNLSLTTKISERMSTVLVKEVLEKSKNIIFLKDHFGKNNLTKIFLNGFFIGFTEKTNELIDEVKNFRNVGLLNFDVSVSFNDIDNEISIFSDEGRLIRPLFPVKNGKLLIKSSDGFVFKDLVNRGLIKYLDHSEISNSVIAFFQKDLEKYHNDYCEIAPSMMLGIMASIIPFPDHSQSPRNCYQASMGKQAMSIFALSHLVRTDTVVHVLQYPHRPLVSTQAAEFLGFNDMPSGMMCEVAIMCYGGFNQEDSILLNYSAVQRGLFWATTYRTHIEEERKHGTHSYEKIVVPPIEKQKKDLNYSLLDENGIIRIRDFKGKNIQVQKGDVIVGKISVSCPKNGIQEVVDSSLVIKKGEEGFIDRVYTFVTPNGYKMVKVVIRTVRIPEIGDKFASRAAQKGTCGMVYSQEDMPFTKDGRTPDIIINPHCLAGDSVIKMKNGIPMYIKDIYNKNLEIVTISPRNLNHSNTKYIDGFKKDPTELLKIETYSDRIIKCTPEHKFLIWNEIKKLPEWKETKDLVPHVDKMIIFNTILPLTDNLEEIDKATFLLNSFSSFGRYFNYEECIVLCRLLSVVKIKGCVCKDFSFINFTDISDVLSFISDIEFLGLEKPTYSVNNAIFRIDLLNDFVNLLLLLNVNSDKLQEFIKNGTKNMKREFLSCFQNRVVLAGTRNKNKIYINDLEVFTERSKFSQCKKYCLDLIQLYLELGIKSSLSVFENVNSTEIKLYIKFNKDYENVKQYIEIIDYRFSFKEKAASLCKIEYFLLQKNINVTFKQYQDSFCFSGTPTIGIKSISKCELEPVYDFTTISSNHSFVANSFISHNCIPSRMTVNQLLECILGKVCCAKGEYGDATPFTSSSTNIAEKLCNDLGMCGMDKHGLETMYNGMTGEIMGQVFIGPVYYQRLKHLVSDKMHARSTGPVTTLTRQPLEGRSRDGGLRFGEMERDCMIVHGNSMFLTERLCMQSDPFVIVVCQQCGNIATNQYECVSCGTDKVSKIRIPYVSKLLIQLLNSMCLKTSISAQI
jgi:DNA-directed RNA polymerase II subunit RPB2